MQIGPQTSFDVRGRFLHSFAAVLSQTWCQGIKESLRSTWHWQDTIQYASISNKLFLKNYTSVLQVQINTSRNSYKTVKTP